MVYCVRCGKFERAPMTDCVCSEDCWIQLFQGAKFDYQTGVKVEEKE